MRAFDWVVRYEGEDAVHKLLLHLEGEFELENVPNLLWMQDGKRNLRVPPTRSSTMRRRLFGPLLLFISLSACGPSEEEIALSNKLAAKAVEAIAEAGRTGQIGDGKIFVIDLESAVRIRTGESGEEAL